MPAIKPASPLTLPPWKKGLVVKDTTIPLTGGGTMKLHTYPLTAHDWTGQILHNTVIEQLSVIGGFEPYASINIKTLPLLDPVYKDTAGFPVRYPRVLALGNVDVADPAGPAWLAWNALLAGGLQAYLDERGIAIWHNATADQFLAPPGAPPSGIGALFSAYDLPQWLALGMPIMDVGGPLRLFTAGEAPPFVQDVLVAVPLAFSGRIAGGDLLCLTMQPISGAQENYANLASDSLAPGISQLAQEAVDAGEAALVNTVKGDFSRLKMVFWHQDYPILPGGNANVLATQRKALSLLSGVDATLNVAGYTTSDVDTTTIVNSFPAIIKAFWP